ncbi:hypothetical protein BC830DRAFT_1107651 [Chytriomyces sp. MP71]|nr:hypothetical protein BC830DRAFT_1107651 [Chytriomyces sp. MP71]
MDGGDGPANLEKMPQVVASRLSLALPSGMEVRPLSSEVVAGMPTSNAIASSAGQAQSGQGTAPPQQQPTGSVSTGGGGVSWLVSAQSQSLPAPSSLSPQPLQSPQQTQSQQAQQQAQSTAEQNVQSTRAPASAQSPQASPAPQQQQPQQPNQVQQQQTVSAGVTGAQLAHETSSPKLIVQQGSISMAALPQAASTVNNPFPASPALSVTSSAGLVATASTPLASQEQLQQQTVSGTGGVGFIVGVICAGIAGAALLVALMVWWIRRNNQSKRTKGPHIDDLFLTTDGHVRNLENNINGGARETGMDFEMDDNKPLASFQKQPLLSQQPIQSTMQVQQPAGLVLYTVNPTAAQSILPQQQQQVQQSQSLSSRSDSDKPLNQILQDRAFDDQPLLHSLSTASSLASAAQPQPARPRKKKPSRKDSTSTGSVASSGTSGSRTSSITSASIAQAYKEHRPLPPGPPPILPASLKSGMMPNPQGYPQQGMSQEYVNAWWQQFFATNPVAAQQYYVAAMRANAGMSGPGVQ